MGNIGYIPRDQEEDEGQGRDEQTTASERWHAWQAAEALELKMMLKDSQEALLKQVRRYADQLELIDPDGHNAAEEIGNVVLTLSHAENAQDRLDALTIEARRLLVAVTEAKRSTHDKPLAKCERTAWVWGLIHGLVGALCGLACALFVEGMLF